MVKDFNVIIDKLEFFDLPIKTEEEAYAKIIDLSRNNEYTTGNLLDYDYFKKYYELIAIDLSKQQVKRNTILKKENTILEFSQHFANLLYK